MLANQDMRIWDDDEPLEDHVPDGLVKVKKEPAPQPAGSSYLSLFPQAQRQELAALKGVDVRKDNSGLAIHMPGNQPSIDVEYKDIPYLKDCCWVTHSYQTVDATNMDHA